MFGLRIITRKGMKRLQHDIAVEESAKALDRITDVLAHYGDKDKVYLQPVTLTVLDSASVEVTNCLFIGVGPDPLLTALV